MNSQLPVGHPFSFEGKVAIVTGSTRGIGLAVARMDAYRDAGGAPMSQREIDYFSLRAVVRLMTLVQQGRHAFESRATDDVLVAGAGAFFCQRLLHRQSQVLTSILDRS